MKFIDLEYQHKKLSHQIEGRVKKILKSGNYILGSENQALEKSLSKYTGRKYSIACSSGTDALLISLMAYGVKSGDAVFTTTFSFIASAEVIVRLGATPIFVDIDKNTFNMDESCLNDILESITNGSYNHPSLKNISKIKLKKLRPKAILAVNIFGNPYDYPKILFVAKKYGLFIIEDAAQSFGSSINSSKSCTFGKISCTSFFPTKPLGCYGDGGAIFTDNKNIENLVKSIRVHGQSKNKYNNIRIGLTGRLDEIQAAILTIKLKEVDREISLRNHLSEMYHSAFENNNLPIKTQIVKKNTVSAWAQFSILVPNIKNRDLIVQKLATNGIPTAIFYKTPLHMQKVFSSLGYKKNDFPISENISKRIINLPIGSHLNKNDINIVTDNLSKLIPT